MRLVRIPQRFYVDHVERDLEAPEVQRATKHHYWIDADDPRIEELYADADFYNDRRHFDDPSLFGLVMSARATCKALLRVAPELGQ